MVIRSLTKGQKCVMLVLKKRRTQRTISLEALEIMEHVLFEYISKHT